MDRGGDGSTPRGDIGPCEPNTRVRGSVITSTTESAEVLDKATAGIAAPTIVPRTQQGELRRLGRYLCLNDFEPAARRILPKYLYGYIAGGVETDAALRDNRRTFEEYGFVPRVLKDVSSRNQTATLFGNSYNSPFGISPMGASALCAYRETSRWHTRRKQRVCQ